MPPRSRRFAGRPYAEVAVEVIRAVRRRARSREPTSRAWRARPMTAFRHPAVVPLDAARAEHVRARAVSRADARLQGPRDAAPGAADGSCAASSGGERTTIVVATSGDTGGAAVEAFRGRDQVDVVVLFPHGRISDVQRRMMTTATDDNVHAIAIEGTFDDCQALVKACSTIMRSATASRLSGVNSINWARIVAQVVYYFVAAVALGAPHRKVAFTVPTGNFGDVFAGYVASRMGLPVDRLVVATNVNDILVRTLATGTYEVRDVMPTTSPSMDIQVSSNFERLLFEAYGRDAAPVRALMASLAQSRRLHDSAARARRDPRRFHRRARRRGGDRRDDPHRAARDRLPARSAHRGRRSRSPRRRRAIRPCRWWCCRPRIRRNFPTRSRPPAACARPCRTGSPTSTRSPSASPCCRPTRPPSKPISLPQAAPRAKELPHERRSHPLRSGTGRRHRRHAASADRLARRLGRLRQPRRRPPTSTASRISSSTWRSRARRGAPRARSPRRSRRSAATSTPATGVEITAYYARVLRGRRAARARRALRHPGRTRASIPTSITREQNVIVQEIGAVEDTPDDLVFEYLQATAFPDQPVGRSILGTPATVRSFDAKRLRAYLGAQLSRPRHGGGGGRRGRSRGGRRRGGAAVSPSSSGRRRRRRRRRSSPAARASRSATSSRSISRSPSRACRSAIPRSYSLQVFTNVLGGGMSSRLFQEVRESAACAIRSTRSTRPMSTPGCSASMPAPTRSMRRN